MKRPTDLTLSLAVFAMFAAAFLLVEFAMAGR